MASACSLSPLVKGEPSKLYNSILKYTGKDRKLTNFLYALSKQKALISKFTSKDFNSQGEIDFDSFIKKVDVKSMLDNKARLQNERESIGAIDSSGNKIAYDRVENILDVVTDYNDTHTDFKATIQYEAGKFYIDLNITNAENFNSNTSLEIRKQEFTAMNSYLGSLGFNTTYSDQTAQNFNILNAYYSLDTIKDLARAVDHKVSKQRASLIVDLMQGHPLVVRLQSIFGADLAEAISKGSGFTTSSTISIDPAAQNMIDRFLNVAFSKLHRIDNVKLSEEVIQARDAVKSKESYYGTDGMTIRDTLKELYNLYYIDKDVLDNLNKDITKVSEAAEKFLRIQTKKLELWNLKHGKDKNATKKLLEIQKQIKFGEYASSIFQFLKMVENSFTTYQIQLSTLESTLQSNPDDLDVINQMSQILLETLEYYNAYSSIVKDLLNIEHLEQDDIIADSALINDIKQLADSINNIMSSSEKDIRKKQFDVVYAYLKLYWGEKDIKEFGGESYSLEELMRLAATDINIFDRFLYSMTEVSDPILALVGEATKQAHNRRDEQLRDILYKVRVTTEKLDTDSSFMFELDSNGNKTGRIISPYDYDKFDKERKQYIEDLKKKHLSRSDFASKLAFWDSTHTKAIEPIPGYEIRVPIYNKANWDIKLSAKQKAYYDSMMNLKAILSKDMALAPGYYDAIQLSNTMTTALTETKGDPKKIYNVIKNEVVDMFYKREDDDEFGMVLSENSIAKTITDFNGKRVMRLPLFFTHKLDDMSRLSTDFSRSMMAYAATATQYKEMNKVIDALMLTKDFLAQRDVAQNKGQKIMGDIFNLGKVDYFDPAVIKGSSSRQMDLVEDFYERTIFGEKKKDAGYLWGTKISLDKLADALTGYTSIVGLSTNFVGAQANALVGKMQMLIESGVGMGGEFFGMKDLMYADVKYFQLLKDVLPEVASNNKSSLLGLLMERFDVLDDFYEKLKESGFYKNPIGKILGNTSLFFMYGLGEHLLHAQTMIAILHNTKVKNSAGKVKRLIDIISVDKVAGSKNGVLKLDSNYTDMKGNIIDDAFLDNLKRKISYCNRSMNGAFGDFEKGMIHRYAVGRLIMNFRQWMPAHYSRRFRGRHWDADLQDWREGYYISSFKFVADCAKDLRRAKFQIATRWEQLSDMERYNIKRAIAEIGILTIVSAALRSLGDEKDKKGNWAYRNLIYQLKRLQMESVASVPVPVPFTGYGPMGFLKAWLKVLNDPMASINTAEKIAKLIDITAVFDTIEEGKFKGENQYLHNLEYNLPFIPSIKKQIEMAEDNSLFNIFEN